MKNALEDNELIEKFLLGNLTEKEVRAFQERVENEREFRRKYRLIKTFPEMMSEEGRKELEKKQAEKIAQESGKRSRNFPKRHRIIALVAVSMVPLAFVALFFILHLPDHQQKSPAVKENSSPKFNISQIKAGQSKDIQAIVLKKKEQHEEILIYKADSGSSSGAISLLTPAEGKKFSMEEMLRFSWTMRTDSFTRFYIVSEGKEKIVLWRGIRLGVREYTIPGGYLYPGKFYWFVGTKEHKRTFIISERGSEN